MIRIRTVHCQVVKPPPAAKRTIFRTGNASVVYGLLVQILLQSCPWLDLPLRLTVVRSWPML